MDFISLPEEVFIMIIRLLDLKSLFNLYNSCQYVKNVFQTNTIIKHWYASRNSMASAKYLNTDFFKDVAGHLLEINLCGVPDLCKSVMLLALKRMKNLKTIDVSYTNIDLLDFEDMYNACPTIKNVSLNFIFDKSCTQYTDIFCADTIEKYQNIFKNMENVHFVGSTSNLVYSNIALHFLSKSDLNIFTLSIIHQKTPYSVLIDEEYDGSVKFKEFYVYFMNLEANYGNYFAISLFQDIEIENFEKIVIVKGATLNDINVYSTPTFKEFFHEKFKHKVLPLTDFDNDLTGSLAIMIFNKKFLILDDNFFKKLHTRIKEYFPYVFEYNRVTPVPNNYDWYYTSPVITTDFKAKDQQGEICAKKRRIGNSNYVLDYDAIFKEKDKINLSLAFNVNYVNPVSLSSNSDFLSKLTFLSLTGTVKYSVEFFNVLFRCCNNLETLDIVAPSISPCASPISRSIPLSKTLKHIRLIDRRFDYKTFFLSLSQCKTLENIHIVDQSSEYTSLADPGTLFANCASLYNVCIKACMSDTKLKEMTRVFNTSKMTHERPYIKVSLFQILLANDRYGLNYDPSIEVFKVFPIRPRMAFY